jgi:hypothetical protein
MIQLPDSWTELSTKFAQQEYAFQRRRDGLVLSVEEGTTSDRYAVSFLPQNFDQDNQPIRSYEENGYLYSGPSLDVALEKAQEWMQENPRD